MIMNIEKTISEHAVSDILTPMLESQDRIVTEDVAPLFDQATGLDTPPASGTVTTTIEESRSVITAIIRKAWTATLTMLGGASVISYIAAAYTYLRNRLQGNETYGIPDRRSEISASSPLAANLALLNDRKIVSIGVPDGLGIMQLMTSKPSAITAIGDDMVYDLCYYPQLSNLIAALPSLNEINIHCKRMTGFGYTGGARWFPATITKINGKTNELYMPDLERMEESAYSALPSENRDFNVWNFPAMKYCRCSFWNGSNGCDWVEEILMPVIESMGGYACDPFALNFTALRKVVWGKVSYTWFSESSFYQNCQNIIHLEYGEGIARNINISNWNPTNALDASRTDLIEEGSTAQNNLQQFLENFKTYIANRLTDNGSGKTLTLSQAVFSEIWNSQGQPQVKGDGLDELRADIHRIIRTDKQWAVNKA